VKIPQFLIHSLQQRLLDVSPFSNLVIRKPLRGYQLKPLHAIMDSILHHKGYEFLLVFPRQSGKNEAVSQLLCYLLNLFQRIGGNIIYGAIGDGLGTGIERLEEHLGNPWNAGKWTTKNKPTRRLLGKASVMFLSSHPAAFVRGKTATHLLVIDEAQDQVGPHIEATFTPMRASTNATAVYIGTVKFTHDFLWQKKRELERETERDRVKRVFFVSPEQVCKELPAYRLFLDTQIRKHGRHHPIVASEYFLEPLDGAGGLFPPRRQVMMRGDHARYREPQAGRIYVATLDVAGEDEAATDPIAQLAHPGRDYTVATIFEVEWPAPGEYSPGPCYRAVDVFIDHGRKHFESAPGGPSLAHILKAWLERWHVAHLVADESGVGLGLVSWLQAALPGKVTGFTFSGGNKARLGANFISLVETGRFLYWTDDAHLPDSDGWWFWRQVEACSYEIPPEGRFEVDLRWGVKETHKTHTPEGTFPTHDDILISAALVAELDRLLMTGAVILGTAASAIIEAQDPLGGDIY
jgi:hypothetical protein